MHVNPTVGLTPTAHAENVLTELRVAHARVMEHAHLLNKFSGTGNPENFHFGTTVFIKAEKARKVLVDTFCRLMDGPKPTLRPIIFVGHAVDSDFEKLNHALGIDLLQFGAIIKVIDTQVLAKEAGIYGAKGKVISLNAY